MRGGRGGRHAEDGGSNGDDGGYGGRKNTRLDTDAIGQRTLAKLMAGGGGASGGWGDAEPMELSGGPCLICGVDSDCLTSCQHCDKAACEMCSRQCDACAEFFCPVCSRVDYSERHDRTFCFGCSEEAAARQRLAAASNHNAAGAFYQAPIIRQFS